MGYVGLSRSAGASAPVVHTSSFREHNPRLPNTITDIPCTMNHAPIQAVNNSDIVPVPGTELATLQDEIQGWAQDRGS